jgi:hypothetical protein
VSLSSVKRWRVNDSVGDSFSPVREDFRTVRKGIEGISP